MYLCKQCGETNIEKMMSKGYGRKCKTICKSCHNTNTIKRGKNNKRKYIEYLGGSCVFCGYNRCDAALEFHHINHLEKDPKWSCIRYWGLEKAKIELDKCALVCSNCHREMHNELNGDVAQWE